jgi:hypothetical protein
LTNKIVAVLWECVGQRARLEWDSREVLFPVHYSPAGNTALGRSLRTGN